MNTEFLWALPLLLVPWLIRLIRPPQPLKIQFSQMRLLEKVLKKVPVTKKTNPWILILIRMFCMLLAIGLLLGLYLKTKSWSSSRSATIIMLDDTWESQWKLQKGSSIWEESLTHLSRIHQQLPIGSKVSFVGTSGRSLSWRTPSALKTELEAMGPSYLGENWYKARMNMRKLMRTRLQEKVHFFFIGEGRVEDVEGLKEIVRALPEDSQPQLRQVKGERSTNVSLHAEARPLKEGVLLWIECKSDGVTGKGKLLFDAIGEGRFEREIEFNGVGLQTVKWVIPKVRELKGRLSLDIDDGLEIDNHKYILSQQTDRLNVALMIADSKEQRLKNPVYYIEKGLKALEQRGLLKLQVKEPQLWDKFDNGQTHLALWLDPPYLSEGEAKNLKRFVERGGRTVFVCGPRVDPDEFKNRLEFLMPAELKEIQRTQEKLKLSEIQKLNFNRLSDSPFRGRWLFYRHQPRTETVMTFEDGAPFWLKRSVGKGSVHFISSPLHLAWSDTVLLGDFPRFLEWFTLSFLPESIKNGSGKDMVAGTEYSTNIRQIKRLLPSEEADLSQVEPGIYEIQNQQGEVYEKAANFESKVAAVRSDIGEWVKGRGAGEHQSWQKLRLDPWLAIFLTFFIFIEAWYLLRRHKLRVV